VYKLNIKNEIAALVDVLGACERIKNTPVPFSHSSFLRVLSEVIRRDVYHILAMEKIMPEYPHLITVPRNLK